MTDFGAVILIFIIFVVVSFVDSNERSKRMKEFSVAEIEELLSDEEEGHLD